MSEDATPVPDTASWDDVAAAARSCTACPELVASRTLVVPGEAPLDARLLLVGEAPGAEEDLVGRPFVGRSGRLLDSLLEQAGIERSLVAVSNVVKCRPPGNRAPRRAEVSRCRGFLDHQLEALDPALVVTLGSTAAAWFFGPAARIGTLRTEVLHHGGRRVLVSYHPSAALRFGPRGEPARALAEDLARAGAILAAPGPAAAPEVGSAGSLPGGQR